MPANPSMSRSSDGGVGTRLADASREAFSGGFVPEGATPDRTTTNGEAAGRAVMLRLPGLTLAARAARIAILMLADSAAILTVFALAYLGWAHAVLRQSAGVYLDATPLVLLFVLSFLKGGLYPGFGMGAIETLRQLILRISFVFLVLATANFVLKIPHQFSRVTFALTWVGCLAVVPTARMLLLNWLRRVSWWREPVVIVGGGPAVERLTASLSAALSLGYDAAGVLTVPGHGVRAGRLSLPVLGTLSDAAAVAGRGFRVAFLVGDATHETRRLLDYLQQQFHRVIEVRPMSGAQVNGVSVRNLGGLIGLEFRNELLRRRNMVLKRAIDVTVGAGALALALPLIVLAAVAVRLIGRGPAFFSQEREGYLGAALRVWKLRTMYVDAEQRLADHLRRDPIARREWESKYKLSSDPRVLPFVGSLLRRFSIDELPQLWQVVRGEMSLVGPRPFPAYHLERFPHDFRALRQRLRPGITGLWQVMVRSDGGLEEQQAYDTFYIRNWSLWMDLYVLARTLTAVFGARGAY